jgi:O-antigen/teichoic acid export membrane protein
MALGQSKVILYRSILDLVINTVLSIVLVHFWGYLGAAIATILTLYFWTVPYNLYKISKGFDVGALQTLPFKKIGFIFLLSVIPVPLVMFNLLLPNNAYLFKLLLAGILYFPLTGILLLKFNLLEIPQQYFKYIPDFISSRLMNHL